LVFIFSIYLSLYGFIAFRKVLNLYYSTFHFKILKKRKNLQSLDVLELIMCWLTFTSYALP